VGQPILITGATGFIGLALARRLRGDGQAVRALVRPRPSDDPALCELQALGAEVITGDLGDPQALSAALSGVALVFHSVGQLQIAGLPDALYEQTHVAGTRALLEAVAAQAPAAQVVYLSTTGVLGPTGPTPHGEDAPLRPETIYERTKAQGETLALELARQHRIWLVVARPALVYGPGDLHLLGWFRAIERGVYRVIGRGDSLLHPIYIDDLVEGLLRCAKAPASGQIYNLVGEAPVSIAVLATAIAAAQGRRLPWGRIPAGLAWLAGALLEAIPGLPPERLPLTKGRVAFMTASRAYNGQRARDELGFVPQTGLDEGMRQAVAWYRNKQLLRSAP
jgi:nucleoside-diphosphate-sugar epimerase